MKTWSCCQEAVPIVFREGKGELRGQILFKGPKGPQDLVRLIFLNHCNVNIFLCTLIRVFHGDGVMENKYCPEFTNSQAQQYVQVNTFCDLSGV